MLYTPPDPTLRLWDTWLIQEADVYHLFYLQRHPHEIGCSSIGHAMTRDWFHWETLPHVLEQGTGTAWDAGPLMTGMVIKHDGRYYLFYGAMTDDRVQRIGLAISNDLIHWEKFSQNPILEPDPQWYETDPSQAINYETAWRDPYVFYHEPEQCFYAFICARVVGASSDLGGGCVAVARSRDLLTWEQLPPAYVSDTMTCLEVPEYFALNGKHYLTYTSSYHFGTPYPVHDAYQATGTFYLVSDAMLHGYQEPNHSNILNASFPNESTNYVGRSIPQPESHQTRLFYYQNVLPVQLGESLAGSFSLPKYLQQTEEHNLHVIYAPEILAPHLIEVAAVQNPTEQLTLVAENLADGVFEATITTTYAGIGFRLRPQRDGMLEGLAVWLAPSGETMRVLLGTLHCANGPQGIRPAFGSPSALRLLVSPADDYHVRVICRGAFVDVYVNDVLYLSHTYAPQSIPLTGSVGAFYAGQPKQDAIREIRVQRLKL